MNWRKQHKWFGIILFIFIVLFCVSGIILNHRHAFAKYSISRKYLPPKYRYDNWNNALLRGTVALNNDTLLLYGNSGMWYTDTLGSFYNDANSGLPKAAELRAVRSVVKVANGHLFAATGSGLYESAHSSQWQRVSVPVLPEERLTDLTLKGDTLLLLSRSNLYVALPPYKQFTKVTLTTPAGYDGKVSLFKTVWLLHSGALFGTVGIYVVDVLAIALIILCLTGLIYWLLPVSIKRARKAKKAARQRKKMLRYSLLTHDRLGRYTFVPLLLLTITGWALRPPVLIALVQGKVQAVPGSSLDSDNPWNDKLRMIRYDRQFGDYVISTSDGFYSFASLNDIPEKVPHTPPVSVMGLNVWERDNNGMWLCGSFSGMFKWDRSNGVVYDFFSGERAKEQAGPPFGQVAVAGYSHHYFPNKMPNGLIFRYDKGCDVLPMPSSFKHLPMSLFGVALEVHTGRIYPFPGVVSLFFIFIAGITVAWVLITGFKVRLRIRKRKKEC